MTISIQAIYENGVLKPEKPLPLDEHERVHLMLRRGPSLAEQTAGIIRWTGDAQAFDRLMKESEEALLEDA